jgi:hypothetical protein
MSKWETTVIRSRSRDERMRSPLHRAKTKSPPYENCVGWGTRGASSSPIPQVQIWYHKGQEGTRRNAKERYATLRCAQGLRGGRMRPPLHEPQPRALRLARNDNRIRAIYGAGGAAPFQGTHHKGQEGTRRNDTLPLRCPQGSRGGRMRPPLRKPPFDFAQGRLRRGATALQIYSDGEEWSWMIFQPSGNLRKTSVKRP